MPKNNSKKKKPLSAAQRLLNASGYVAPKSGAAQNQPAASTGKKTFQHFEQAQTMAQQLVAGHTATIEEKIAEEEAGTAAGGKATGLDLLYAERSGAYLTLCQVDEAMQDAELAIDEGPESARAYAARAAVLVDLFNFKDALIDLDKAEELDPSLLSVLRDLRLRATEEKWGHNCYLQKQVALQEKYKCDYVLLLETEEGEWIEEPWTFAEDANICFPGRFQDQIQTGQKTIGMLRHLKNAQTKTSEKFLESSEEDDLEKYNGMLRAQLQREFGPDKDYDFYIPKVSEADQSFALYHSLVLYEQAIRKHGNCYAALTAPNNCQLFYPGAPKWHHLDPQAFVDALSPPGRAPPQARADNGIQIPQIMDAMTRYRATLAGRELKCTGCGTVEGITDKEDPQECICGAIFCSFFCHDDHWEDHKAECGRRVAPILGFCKMTMAYWQFVTRGMFPCKREIDVVAAWKERKMTRANCGDEVLRLEEQFYCEHERMLWGRAIAPLTTGTLHSSDPELFQFRHNEVYGKFTMRFVSLLPTDSICRVKAKFDMSEIVYVAAQASEKYYPFLKPQTSPISPQEFAQEIKDWIKQHNKMKEPGAENFIKYILNDYIAGIAKPGAKVDTSQRVYEGM